MSSPSFSRPASQSQRHTYNTVLQILAIIILFVMTACTLSDNLPRAHKQASIQHDFKRRSTSLDQVERLEAVKHQFMQTWTVHVDDPHTSNPLHVLSGKPGHELCSRPAMLIELLDTLWIMNLKDEFNKALEVVVTIDFKKHVDVCEASIFESTTRYLAGLLAAYDLSHEARILPKINELGDVLSSAFDPPSERSCEDCDLSAAHAQVLYSENAPLADLGTLYLELGRMWQITRDEKYLNILSAITQTFEHTQSQSTIPGLWPERLNTSRLEDGDATRFATSFNNYSLGALSNSAYEYLVKAHLMFGGLTSEYSDMWTRAAHPLRDLMIFQAPLPPDSAVMSDDVLFSGILTRDSQGSDIFLEPRVQQSACFAGGMFALAGRIFENPSDIKTGAALTNGCVWAFDTTITNNMPETLTLVACDKIEPNEKCTWHQTAFEEVQISSSDCNLDGCHTTPIEDTSSLNEDHVLRPEVIESLFTLYRTTGDEMWRDKGWTMFQQMVEQTRNSPAYVMPADSTRLLQQSSDSDEKHLGSKKIQSGGRPEAVLLAETLKCFWLLFSDPEVISLDEWVLNTKAHPLRLVENNRAYF